MTREADPEQSLALRAAWLHFAGGLTQAEVARRLDLPAVKAHRLIARAVEAGAVKVIIDGAIAECAELETRLCARYALAQCEVAPDLGESGLPLRALGQAGAAFLRRAIEQGRAAVIGLGHGRTLTAAVERMPQVEAGHLRFVALTGGLTRNYAANPHDVMHRLALKTGAQVHVLPVPLLANSAADRAVILAQPGVRDLFDLARDAGLKIAGIGPADGGALLATTGMIAPGEIAELAGAGAVGELLGHFFDARGGAIRTPLTSRTLAVDLDGPEGSCIVGIAGGPDKVAAIAAVLESGRLHGLITDERTARALLA